MHATAQLGIHESCARHRHPGHRVARDQRGRGVSGCRRRRRAHCRARCRARCLLAVVPGPLGDVECTIGGVVGMSASPSAVAGAVERAVDGRVVARAVGGSAVVGGPSHALSSGCAGTSANSYRTAAARLPCRPPPADARDDRPRVDRPRSSGAAGRSTGRDRGGDLRRRGWRSRWSTRGSRARRSPRFALASTTAPAADRRELDDPAVLERRREAPATVMRSAGSMTTRERARSSG